MTPGQILISIASAFLGALLCDGATYNTSDYPLLAAQLGATGGTFTVPDYRNKFLLAAGNGLNVGDQGGEATHTLTKGEMPIHHHAVRASNLVGNYHYPGSAIPAANIGQANFATGSSNAVMSDSTIADEGSGAAHNNLPPYCAVNFFIAHD